MSEEPPPAPKKKRVRTSLACLRCSRSKAKCEHDKGGTATPCRRCSRLGLTCEFVGYTLPNEGGRTKDRQGKKLSNSNIPSNKNCYINPMLAATQQYDYQHHHQQHQHQRESISEAEDERRVRAREAAPLPLLREWVEARRRSDCELLGRALLLAHSGGLSLSNVRESSATSTLEEGASMTRDKKTTASVFGLARTPREHSQLRKEQQQQCQGQVPEEEKSHNEINSAALCWVTDTPSGTSVAAGRPQPSGAARAAGLTEAVTTAAESLWLSWTPFDDDSLAIELGDLVEL